MVSWRISNVVFYIWMDEKAFFFNTRGSDQEKPNSFTIQMKTAAAGVEPSYRQISSIELQTFVAEFFKADVEGTEETNLDVLREKSFCLSLKQTQYTAKEKSFS